MGFQNIVARPAHVPADLAFDFDMYRLPPEFGVDCHAYWKSVQDSFPEIFWTPRYGGHWVVTRGADIAHVAETHAQFSNNHCFIPKGMQPWVIPVQLDPPLHTAFRKLLTPAFLPRNVLRLEAKAQALAAEIIERAKPRGEIEFVSEFAGVMPIIVFLSMLDLPAEDGPMLRGWLFKRQNVNEPTDNAEGWANMTAYVDDWIVRRRANPGDDLISQVIYGQVDGRPLTDHEIQSTCLLLLGGGLDTVAVMTSYIAWHLAGDEPARRRLREHPEIIPRAVEEFARRYGLTHIAREVRQDMDYRGHAWLKGEQVLTPYPLYGLDDRIHTDPMRLDLDREDTSHKAFGSGVHTCIGAVLARREMAVFLREWLPRIPDWRLKAGATPLVSTGLINSIKELWLEWDA